MIRLRFVGEVEDSIKCGCDSRSHSWDITPVNSVSQCRGQFHRSGHLVGRDRMNTTAVPQRLCDRYFDQIVTWITWIPGRHGPEFLHGPSVWVEAAVKRRGLVDKQSIDASLEGGTKNLLGIG